MYALVWSDNPNEEKPGVDARIILKVSECEVRNWTELAWD
jgi:hypothetical protein